MQIIILSGGSGKRLWPLSNNTRSKQFLKLLAAGGFEGIDTAAPHNDESGSLDSQQIERSGTDISRPAGSGVFEPGEKIHKDGNVEGSWNVLPSQEKESMLQRVNRQLKSSGLGAEITIATSASQRDIIVNQLGTEVSIVTEPERRDTFPAIALAGCYLAFEKSCPRDEVVVVMPCDPYTEMRYFETIEKMVEAVESGVADLVLMGVEPTYASSKYGYIVPDGGARSDCHASLEMTGEKLEITREKLAKTGEKLEMTGENTRNDGGIYTVSRFTEKPSEERAKQLIEQGAFWNGGVFAFKLGYLLDIVGGYLDLEGIATAAPHNDEKVTPRNDEKAAPVMTEEKFAMTGEGTRNDGKDGFTGIFAEIRNRYAELPKISFDYEVAEKAQSAAVVRFAGQWKDLGTWNTLSEELGDTVIGNAIIEDSHNTHIVNELELPIMCIGAEDLIVAASPDGILVSRKDKSEKIKSFTEKLKHRPMYEERRWGEYKVIDEISFDDGYKALTKQLVVRSGLNISYQIHHHRDEVWTIVDGEGLVVLDGVVSSVSRGVTVHIAKGTKHAIRALTDLRFIEVQSGDMLVEEDIERFEWEW